MTGVQTCALPISVQASGDARRPRGAGALRGVPRVGFHLHGGASVAGINTARDKIGAQGTRPYIRRDFDSLIGFSPDLAVQTDITFFPNPPRNRTLKKDLHIRYSYLCEDDVRRLRHCHDQIVLMILVIPPLPTFLDYQ